MQTLVISMDDARGASRRAALLPALRECGLSPRVVQGVNVRSASAPPLRTLATPACAATCTASIIGCGASHIECWRIAARQMAGEWTLILEDDAALVPDFTTKLQQAVAAAPADAEVILLGCFACSPQIQAALGAPPRSQDAATRSVRAFGGAHGYLVSPAGAQHMLQLSGGKVVWHIDVQMSAMTLDGLRIVAVNGAPLVTQAGADVSSTATQPAFPFLPQAAVKAVGGGGSLYFANVGLARIGTLRYNIQLTPLHLVYFALGALGGDRFWPQALACGATDVAIAGVLGGVDVGPSACLCAVFFAAGACAIRIARAR